MENLNEINNLTTPKTFIQNLEKIAAPLQGILIDFKKYYVLYNKIPDYQDYQNHFENIKGNLNDIDNKLLSLSNGVNNTTDELNKKLFALDLLIKKERVKNKKYKRLLGIVEDKNNAASELISDYKNIYDSGYLRNWALFIATIVVGFSIKFIYKKPYIHSFTSSLK